jgi:hypothetical protein
MENLEKREKAVSAAEKSDVAESTIYPLTKAKESQITSVKRLD